MRWTKYIILIIALTQLGFIFGGKGLERKIEAPDKATFNTSCDKIGEEIADADRMQLLMYDLGFCLWYEGFKVRGSSIDQPKIIYSNFLKFVDGKTPNEIRTYVAKFEDKRAWLLEKYSKDSNQFSLL